MYTQRKSAWLATVITGLFALVFMLAGAGYAYADTDYDLGNYNVTFDQSYRVLDDIESTPYPDYFYIVPSGTLLDPIVKDSEDNLLGSECYKASYSECKFYTERNEWDKIDENSWIDEFPQKPGVYFCKVEGVAPYTGSFEWIDLIRITPRALPADTFDQFVKVAGWYDHEWFVDTEKYSFKVPCSTVSAYSEGFNKNDLYQIDITVTTADGKVYEPEITEDPDYPGDFIYAYDAPMQEWGAGYTITFKNGDSVKTIEGAVKKNVKLSIKASALTFTGKALKPKVTVKDGSNVLAAGTDYEFSADDPSMVIKNVGMYGIYITSPLTSKYSIHDILIVKVNPKGTSISKLTAAKKGFTAKWKKQSAQTTGYQIQYALKSNFKGAKTVTVTKNKTVSKKIAKLKSKKIYYVRIRTYKKVGSTNYYSTWSAKKKIKTK